MKKIIYFILALICGIGIFSMAPEKYTFAWFYYLGSTFGFAAFCMLTFIEALNEHEKKENNHENEEEE